MQQLESYVDEKLKDSDDLKINWYLNRHDSIPPVHRELAASPDFIEDLKKRYLHRLRETLKKRVFYRISTRGGASPFVESPQNFG